MVDLKNMNKKNHIYHLVILLVCLVVLTFNLTTGLFAKYVAYDSASDSARVAKFDVTVSDLTASTSKLSSFVDSDINSGAAYSFSVTSNSEVDVNYKVIVALNVTELPAWFSSIVLDASKTPTSQGYNDTNSRYEFVFENVGVFHAGQSSTANHSFVIKTGAGVFDPSYNDQALTVTVDVVATQID